jgi:hypothetical protein
MPLVAASGAQALAVTGAYATLFAVTALVLTWRRETLE